MDKKLDRMKNSTIIFYLCSLFILIGIPAHSQDIFKKPEKQELVVDNAKVFSQSEITLLKNKLHQFSNETSTQILVFTTSELYGYEVGDFAQRLGESWGVGSDKFDNGIVIIFKPKDHTKGRVSIQTGYGIEALIPDATAKRIIQQEMIPEFRKGNIFKGIDQAVNICISLTKAEFTAEAYNQRPNNGKKEGEAPPVLAIMIMIAMFGGFFFYWIAYAKQFRAGTKSGLSWWTILLLLNSGNRRNSDWDNFSSGSGSFGGGFGGGGFGGFGGGSFGGGGASGSW